MPGPGKPVRRREPSGPAAATGLALLVTGVLLVRLSRLEAISYDGFWHVFIARQERLRLLVREILDSAHPPLFFVLLKAATALGQTPLAYRLVSIAATLASVALVAVVVRRTTGNRWLSAAAAFAYGLSRNAVETGLEVRSYALAVTLMLAAFVAYLELFDQAFRERASASRVVFAGALVLGLCTHYAVAFFLVACLAVPAAVAALDSAYRRRVREGLRRYAWRNMFTFALPLLALGVAYLHMRLWTGRMNHLPAFIFDPKAETASAFLLRNTRAQFDLFSPVALAPGAATALASLLGGAAVVWSLSRLRRERGWTPVLPLLFLLATAGGIGAAAILGLYPYGGPLRHQMFVFPFALTAVVVLVDRAGAWVSGPFRMAVPVLVAAAAIANTIQWMRTFKATPQASLQRPVDDFRRTFPSAPAIYMDQFSLIYWFGQHYDWRWTLVARRRDRVAVDVWLLSQGRRFFFVCRDRRQWLADLSREPTYQGIAACMEATGVAQVSLFRAQMVGASAEWPVADSRALADGLSGRFGLRVESMVVQGEDVYAGFGRLSSRRLLPP